MKIITDIDYNKIFTPDLSPKEMLKLGVFGGYYFKNDFFEFPKSWFKDAKISIDKFDVNMNYFNIKSGLSIEHWMDKGWIFAEDPIGWFQWYCRYSMGRRLPHIDKVQIMRWKSFGPRHKGGIKKNCPENDYTCRPKQRQGLLQWGYNPFF